MDSDVIPTQDERKAEFEASDAYHKFVEFREQMSLRLRKAENPEQYLDLAEEFRLFHNKVHVNFLGCVHWDFEFLKCLHCVSLLI